MGFRITGVAIYCSRGNSFWSVADMRLNSTGLCLTWLTSLLYACSRLAITIRHLTQI